MKDKLGENLKITWKSFLLEQVNSRRGMEWKAWDDPRFTSRDIPPHEAAKSILAEQGEDAFSRFHIAVFRAHHQQKRDIANPLELMQLAREVDVDPTVLAEDLRTRKYRAAVGADHQESDEHDIFGVPTILFDGYQPTFIKTRCRGLGRTGRRGALPRAVQHRRPASVRHGNQETRLGDGRCRFGGAPPYG